MFPHCCLSPSTPSPGLPLSGQPTPNKPDPLHPCTLTSKIQLKKKKKTPLVRTSLGVQWLRLHAPNAGALVSIPRQGTRSHMLQLRVHIAVTKQQRPCMWQPRPGRNKKIFLNCDKAHIQFTIFKCTIQWH